MSYSRSGLDGCDVYVIADVRGGFTCFCEDEAFRCGTRAEMVEHLLGHETCGKSVEPALAALRYEIATGELQ